MGSFRPRWFPAEDRRYWAWLACWSTVGSLLALVLATTAPRPVARLVELPDRCFLPLRLEEPRTSHPTPPVVVDVPWTPSAPPLPSTSEPAPRKEALVQLAPEGRLLSRLSRVGQGAARILTPDDPALEQHVEVVEEEIRAARGLRRSQGTRADEDIGAIERYEVGNAEIVGEARVLVPPHMERRRVEGHEPLSVPARNVPTSDLGPLMRRLRFCMDRRRAEMPGLSGRLVLDWTLGDHRALDVALVEDTVEDEALEQCLVQTVGRFRFGPEAGRMRLPLVVAD